MREVAVVGVYMTKFGKYLDRSLRDLGKEAVLGAVRDAGMSLRDIKIAYVANGMAGLITGQEGVRGQVILKEVGLEGLPILNVENACGSGTTAVFGAWLSVASGFCDVALALGVEKLYCGNTNKSMAALAADSDVEMEGRMGFLFPARYAMSIARHMDKYGTTREQIAKVSVKNHKNGSLNPYAQHQKVVSVAEVLNSRVICDPVTLLMCCPIGDGASAVILADKKTARRLTSKPITIAALALQSGRTPDIRAPEGPNIYERTVHQAYEQAAVGPQDLEVIELHAAASPAELLRYEDFGLCRKGEAGRMIDEGKTDIGGKIPCNPSGGLEAKGHPVGATGGAQITEVVWQMRGQAGKRQIDPIPKLGMVHNGGGLVGGEPAIMTATILKR